MGRLDKVVDQFLRRPSEASFREVEYVLRAFEYTREGKRGKHQAFVKSGHPTFVVPLKKGRHMVKSVYIKKLVDLLNLEEWYEQQQRS